MLRLRKASDRGRADHGWLESYHTFSFGDYHDAEHMGFSSLRVINDDRVQPGKGFGLHPHRDMEIISYVLEGSLAHKDSMDNGSEITAGEVQRMSAGKGVWHSEFNPSDTDPVHFLQIWIYPDEKGIEPEYEQRRIDPAEKLNRLFLVASADGREGSMRIHQNASLYIASVEKDKSVSLPLSQGRKGWLQVAQGEARLNDLDLKAGDGVAISDEESVELTGITEAEVLFFDLD